MDDRYEDFKITGETFAERTGEPTEFDAALGRIVLAFSYLEDSVRNVICLLLQSDLRVGVIVTAEIGFRQRLDVLASLVRHRWGSATSPSEPKVIAELKQLLRICRRAEELRNQHLHSGYSRTARTKTSAKADHGLRVSVEPTSADILLDVADYIVNVAMTVEEFPLSLGLATTVGGGADYVEYSHGNQLVARFRFGEAG